MAELIPRSVRVAVRNAAGGWGPFTVREIEDLFESHDFTDADWNVEDAGGQRRTAVEAFHAPIDWTSPEMAQRYLDVVADVLDRYPEDADEPGAPGRTLRLALRRAGLMTADGRLELPAARTPRTPAPGIWTADRPRIFMSHLHAYRAEVTDLARRLESFAFACFVAHVQIQASRDWQDAIENALATCHVLVAYVTPDFDASDWTEQEVGWALGRGIQVIPLNAGRQPYGFFGARQSLPLTPNLWPTATALFRAIVESSLRGDAGSVDRELMARTIVRAFCDSPSYDQTRARFTLLRLIPAPLWSADMIAQLDVAKDENSQIAEAGLSDPRMPAPDAVEELIQRVIRGRTP